MKSLSKKLNLTAREEEVLGLLATGKLYKEIAFELTIGLDTVKKHCNNIYKKLQVRNRTEAINLTQKWY